MRIDIPRIVAFRIGSLRPFSGSEARGASDSKSCRGALSGEQRSLLPIRERTACGVSRGAPNALGVADRLSRGLGSTLACPPRANPCSKDFFVDTPVRSL